MQQIIDYINNRKVLFITTKNIDYIRNSQEINIIKEYATSVDLVYSDKKNYFLRIFNVWTQINKKVINKNDIVFVGFEPQFIIPFVGWKFKNKIIVIDFFISVYDTLICDRKKFKERSIISRFCRWMDKKTIKEADAIITDTKAQKEFFIEEFGGERNKFHTIYLCADSNIYFPRPQIKPEALKEKFVVVYFGSILPLQGVDVVLNTIRKFRDNKDIFFEIIGPVNNKYDKPEQENVCYIEWLSQEELAEHISYADLCLAGHFNGEIKKAQRTIPGKAFIYEAMKKKMVLGKGSANSEYFSPDDHHFFVEMGNSELLKEVILEVANKNGK